MDDEGQTPEAGDGEENERRPDMGDDKLALLVRIANAGAMTLDITLLVGGVLVSGLLVGNAEFFDGLAEYLEANDGEGGTALGQIYRNDARAFREDYVGDDFGEALDAPYVAAYIHLRDARIWTDAGRPIPSEGTFWRGRLDSVDGWWIGTIGRQRQPS